MITFMFFYIFYLGLWKFIHDENIFILSLIVLLIYLNMQLHVHLDVNSVRAITFFFIGLFKSNLDFLKNSYKNGY